jgi:hypothetical protein
MRPEHVSARKGRTARGVNTVAESKKISPKPAASKAASSSKKAAATRVTKRKALKKLKKT